MCRLINAGTTSLAQSKITRCLQVAKLSTLDMQDTSQIRSTITYQNDISPESLNAIKDHLSQGERDDPLVFSGRQNIITHIDSQLAKVKRLGGGAGRCLTEIVQGAPGAGKTALINELKHRLDGTVAVVTLTGIDLNSKEEFVALVLSQLNSNVESLTKTVTRKTTTSGGVTGIATASHTRETERKSVFDSREIVSAWQMIETGWKSEEKTILLCIDEAQTIPAYLDSEHNQIVINLHTTQTGNLHVLPLFTGLLDTRRTLNTRGASRENRTPFQLGGLSKSEAKDVVIGVLNHDSLGLNGLFSEEDQAYIASSLIVASDQWPRHLHHYIQGVLNEILDDQQRESPLSQINLNRALDYGHQARINYYEGRFESLQSKANMEQSLSFIQELSQQTTTRDIDISSLSARLRNNHDVSPLDFDVMFRAAVRSGVLTPARTVGGVNVTQMPIPSMRTFLQCQQVHDQTLSRLREIHAQQLSEELKAQ